MGERRSVAVVVVTWNSAAHVPGLLGSLRAGLEGVAEHSVIVVDNASSDVTAATVAALAPAATLVHMGRNAGYAAAINAGVEMAPVGWPVLVLNPDLELRPGMVRALLRAFDLPYTGIAVPQLLEADGRLARSLRRDPTVLRAVGEAVLGGRRAGRIAALGETVEDPRDYEQPAVVEWASGAAMLISPECLETVGPWDESYFLYSEETDFALRTRDAGLIVRYVPDAVAVHRGGDAHYSTPLWSLLTRNRVRLFASRHGRLRTAGFWAAVALNEGLRSLRARRSSTHREALRDLLRRPLRAPEAAT